MPHIHFQINNQDLIQLFYLLLVHKLLKLWILRHLSSLTMDSPKSLWDFGTLTSPLLLHTQGLSLVHLPPDLTVVGPSCSNLMDGICSSPLWFLCSVGHWSNSPGSSFNQFGSFCHSSSWDFNFFRFGRVFSVFKGFNLWPFSCEFASWISSSLS